jgi:hypothetical protein
MWYAHGEKHDKANIRRSVHPPLKDESSEARITELRNVAISAGSFGIKRLDLL